jgi:hypothetical protein
MKNQYVILTGSKNNAGDFFIKYRAKQLFKELRPDRKIIDFNAWEAFDEEKIKTVNESKALILTGGPSLQKDMRPNIYKMTKNLDDIQIPITSMGIGWKSARGLWEDTYNYELSHETIKLLERINNSGYMSSVRDYHTLNCLRFKGFDNFLMTGCPAYYNLDYIYKDQKSLDSINKVAFSLGVSFIKSKNMENLIKDNILSIRDYFSNKDFEVVFHHSLDRNKFLSTHNSTAKHVDKHNEMASWLEKNNIKYVDISGSAENLITYYSDVDFHVGYRLHAHICMSSTFKPSIMIAEDGRGMASKDVIGGIVLRSVYKRREKLIDKVLSRLNQNYDRIIPNDKIRFEIIKDIEYEGKTGFIRTKSIKNNIYNNFEIIKSFLLQLP